MLQVARYICLVAHSVIFGYEKLDKSPKICENLVT